VRHVRGHPVDRRLRDVVQKVRQELSALAIGFTVTGPGQAERIERALEVGGFDTVQATWNLLERLAGPALAVAHSAGLGVIVKEALANGRVLEHVSDTVASAAALAQPWADVVLSGVATVEHLESNLRALDVDYDDELDAELAGLVEEPEAYWATRAALPWN
jgi:aryl-alcohol dehydrogenase-like predicted oxidoreductase